MGDEGRVRRWVRIFRPDARSEISEELDFHFEQRVRENIARGMEPKAAREAATARLGDLEGVRDECADLLVADRRSEARRVWLNISWLDFRLGFRMLVKYPGLTLIGGLGMAMAIAIGAGYTVVLNAMLETRLPLPEGDRVVVLQNRDTRTNRKPAHSVHDFVAWRDGVRSVQDVGAYRTVSRNLVAPDGTAEPLAIAEMSASGFRVAGVQPVMGRFLVDDDELASAPPVVVIGYDVWQRRFAADRHILGRELRFGSTFHTVVGVMPKDFEFPLNHQFWMPLRAEPSAYARGEGPSVVVFGRLAPGVTVSEARAEVIVVGQNAASSLPETHEHLRAEVQPYTHAHSGMDNPGDVTGANVFRLLFIVLMIVISTNVAALVYARTAVRRGEILVRTALGASRTRVVAQLFAEALVLAVIAAGVGLALVGVALHQVGLVVASLFGGQLPFWFELRLSPGSVGYGLLLAVIAAVITGVIPALKATGRRLQSGLQQLSTGGSEMLLGRTWTFLIVGQVTFAVALLPVAVFKGSEMIRYGTVDAGFADDEYLSSFVHMERDWEEKLPAVRATTEFNALYADRIVELMRRLRAAPGVAAVTYAWTVPGNEPYALIEVESTARPNASSDSVPTTSIAARMGRVDSGFFDAFDIPILTGRAFTPADADSSSTAVIVNQSFAQRIAGDGSVLGRRIREGGDIYRTPTLVDKKDGGQSDRWYEIVGVVPDFPNSMIPEQIEAKVYRAATAGRIYPAALAVHVRGAGASNFAPQLRKLTSTLDPALQLQQVRTLEAINDRNQSAIRMLALAIAIVTLSVLLLSAAGIYAMMSLAVARRRREIGIRAALGANPRRILASIFARAATQIGMGVGLGLVAFLFVWKLNGGDVADMLVLEVIVTAIMFAVGLLASVGPARRGLRIQPTEALRHE